MTTIALGDLILVEHGRVLATYHSFKLAVVTLTHPRVWAVTYHASTNKWAGRAYEMTERKAHHATEADVRRMVRSTHRVSFDACVLALRARCAPALAPLTVEHVCEQAHDYARRAGFYNDDGTHKSGGVAGQLALIHSEVSEALEAHRFGNLKGLAEELADVVIRVADLARALNFDLSWEILHKMAANEARPHRHGKAY